MIINDIELDPGLARDLTWGDRSIEEEGGLGYIRHVGGRLDVMQSPNVHNGKRMIVFYS